MARRIRSLSLTGPVGRLEALLEEPEGCSPVEFCLVCHPHPLGGGSMHNKVVYRIARALRHGGGAVLRFNFRGVGLSGGAFDHGAGELEDARAALDWLRGRYPQLPYTLAGFSFGSRIILRLGSEIGDARRMVAIGFPKEYHAELAGTLAHCGVPKVFIQSTRDQYGPMKEMEDFCARVAPPKKLIWIEAGDHFFRGALNQLEEAVFRLG
jgi:alpha/beta superfamily hydrolase